MAFERVKVAHDELTILAHGFVSAIHAANDLGIQVDIIRRPDLSPYNGRQYEKVVPLFYGQIPPDHKASIRSLADGLNDCLARAFDGSAILTVDFLPQLRDGVGMNKAGFLAVSHVTFHLPD